LPPVFTLLLGHAFGAGKLKDVRAILLDRDRSKESTEVYSLLSSKDIFVWQQPKDIQDDDKIDLSQNKLQAAIIIPRGWGNGLHNGGPIPLQLVLDGADTNSAPAIRGAVQEILGEYQARSLEMMIDDLPEEVFDLGRQLPEFVRGNFSSSMSPWEVKASIMYNPDLRFIDFAMPGVVGLILQLLTVTLTASSLNRERESGTLLQLHVTPMQKSAIIIGKILPYLGIALIVGMMLFILGQYHFHAAFHNPILLLTLSLIFLLATSGLGVLISSFCTTQTQAVQFSVFFLRIAALTTYQSQEPADKAPKKQERPDNPFTDCDAKPCDIDERTREKCRCKLLHDSVCKSGRNWQTGVPVHGYI
jgi:ABC-2 type transport system permease protein